jgi:hypothetical protein
MDSAWPSTAAPIGFILEWLKRYIMAQQKPEESQTIEQVLRLVDQLSPEGRDEVLEKLKLDDMRREIQKGIDSANRGELIPADVVLDRLRKRAEQRLKEQKSQ